MRSSESLLGALVAYALHGENFIKRIQDGSNSLFESNIGGFGKANASDGAYASFHVNCSSTLRVHQSHYTVKAINTAT